MVQRDLPVKLILISPNSLPDGLSGSVHIDRAVRDDLQCVVEMLLRLHFRAEGSQITVYLVVDPGPGGIVRIIQVFFIMDAHLYHNFSYLIDVLMLILRQYKWISKEIRKCSNEPTFTPVCKFAEAVEKRYISGV